MKPCFSLCFFPLPVLLFLEKFQLWYDCASIFNQMVAMVVKGDETSGGWKKRVVACLLNRLQASNPSP